MSVSEKLRALEEQQKAASPYQIGPAAVPLRDALPQIRALAEAVEDDLDYLSQSVIGTSFVIPETTQALAEALANLDKALP